MPLEAVFNGTIEVGVMDEERIARALRAYEGFRCAFPYPPGYREMLKNALIVLERQPASELRVLSLDLLSSVRIVTK